MVIVRQWGGLGNQMFIDAFVSSLINKGKTVKIDISYYDYFDGTYDLKRIFGIEHEIASKSECHNWAIYELDFFHRIIRKYVPKVIKKQTQIMENNRNYGYNYDDFFSIDNCYIEGYFQSEKYFMEIKHKIIKAFSFPSIDDNNKNILMKIRNSNSVSIHIRRGDYLKQRSVFKTCDVSYYQKAISYIKSNSISPYFFVFSNDIEWCKKNIEEKNICYVDNNNGINSFRDMQLMSECKHNIIANSTFSWWGAWLNKNKDKIVCAPSSWFVGMHDNPVPEDWIRI